MLTRADDITLWLDAGARMGRHAHRFQPAAVVLVIGILLSVGGYRLIAHSQHVEAQQEFERVAENYVDGLRARVNEALLLDPAAAKVADDASFVRFVESQKSLIPIEGLDSELLPSETLKAHAEAARRNGLPVYTETVALGDGHWGFLVTPKRHFFESEPWLPLSMLAAGLACTLGIAGYLILVLRQRQRDLAVMREQARLRGELESTITHMVHAQTEAIHAKEIAESANRAKGEFLANMSHEIRTPMNGILGMTELMLQTELTQKQHHYAATVMQSAEALLGIINDILDFSKIEAGKLDMELVPIDLRAIVESAAELLSVRAREKALEIVVSHGPLTPRYLMGDPVRIRQVISNLLGNAIKFTEKGHILISVDTLLPQEDTPPGHNRVRIAVTDTGIGIANEAKERIFDKFTQADNSTTRKFGGTGLGLSIAKQLCDMMGGEMGVESELGEGTRFWFSMTLEPSGEENDPLAEFGASIDILRGVRVLVVDDLAIGPILLREHLQQVGMRVDICSSGEQALAILHQAVSEFDPVQMAIVDYMMPVMNGEELVRHIKTDPRIANIAVIMMTSTDGRGYLERFEKAGLSSLLSKPLHVQSLIETVATVWEMYKAGHRSGIIADDSFARRVRRQGGGDPIFHHARVLLAEDDRVNQEFAEAILTGFQCNVTVASNGFEAVRLASEQPFDLILMDCQMPQMDGFEASRQLAERKLEGLLPNIPIIALTANAMKGDRQRCLQAGMVDYATKPIRKEHLAKILQKWLPTRFMPKTHEGASLAGIVALVAEDNRINMEFAIEILEGMGCRIITARNGLEALSEAKKDQPYDIILMDVMMPEMDGLQATRQLRLLQQLGTIPAVPIIAVTANAMKGDREICLEAGMDDYLTKPLQGSQLKSLMLKWIPTEKLDMAEMLQGRRKQAHALLNQEIVDEARAVMGAEFQTIVRLYIASTEFVLSAIVRSIRQARDPQSIVIQIHSLRSSSGYMGATRLAELAQDLEKVARSASMSHGDISRLWPVYEEVRYVWENTRRQLEAEAAA